MKNKSYLGKTLTVPNINSYPLPPSHNKSRDSTKINDTYNSIINTEQNKLLGKIIPLQNNGKKLKNINRNAFSYFLSPSTVKRRSNTVEYRTYTTNSESNNTVQEATDGPTEL